MKMKVILLGSAAAIAVTGVQAADLSIAEPVDYVRVCDAFGTGYWYISGTDRCIKLGGSVDFNVDASEDIGGVEGRDWEFSTSGNVNFTTKSMTERGVMSTYIKINVKADGTAELDKLWGSLGHFMAGIDGSAFNGLGSYTYATPVKDGDKDVRQVRLTWAMGGYEFMLGIEDPEDRWGSSTDRQVPDIVLAMNYSHSGVSGHVGLGYTASHTSGSAWGVTADAQIALGSSSNLRIRGSYGGSDGSTNAWVGVVSESSQAAGDSSWSGHVALSQMLSNDLTAAVAFGYNDNGSGFDTHSVNANLVWSKYSGFATGVQVAYTKPADGSSNVVAFKWRSKWDY